jgi:caa(3)-type oxidase subunit IV
MSKRHRTLLLAWIGLLVIGAVEFGVGMVSFNPSYRPLLMLLAIAMVIVVAVMFMRVESGPGTNRIFAMAGIFWLAILLGLAMMDPMTRNVYPVGLSLGG